MIFRRIKAHIEKENWFAVGIDFCIVVIGVFIGIQVANWNSLRADSRSERAILERLQTDLSELEALDAATCELYLQDRMTNLFSARWAIFGVDDRAELTHEECRAIGLSHYPLIGVSGLPILEELKSTGHMALIRDPEIVRGISKVTEFWEGGKVLEESHRSKVTLLSRVFPDLIIMDLEEQAVRMTDFEIDEYDPVYRCDYEAMKGDPAFRNAFGENATLQFSLIEMSVEPFRQAVGELGTALDRALGAARDEEEESP